MIKGRTRCDDQPTFVIKCIIVGNAGTGKSCLSLQFCGQSFRDSHDVTIGVEFLTRVLEDKDERVKMHIWDTAGQESFRAITRSYYRMAAICIVVYDITVPLSLTQVPTWVEDVRCNAPTDVEIVLVGNKVDLSKDRKVLAEEAQKVAESLGIQYFEASAKTGAGVENVFLCPMRAVIKKYKEGALTNTSRAVCHLHSTNVAKDKSCC